jgi:HK97 family phage prohead protease
MTVDIERRSAVELRVAGRKLVGYAAVFDKRTTIYDFTESIAAGAFKASLARGDDVVGLVDHDPGRLLARTRSGTLKLAEDGRGLSFELSLPDTQLGRDILALVERGDVGGASFGFTLPKGGDEWSGSDRTLRNVNLIDISVVNAWPAYPETSVSARSRGSLRRLPLALAKRMVETFR